MGELYGGFGGVDKSVADYLKGKASICMMTNEISLSIPPNPNDVVSWVASGVDQALSASLDDVLSPPFLFSP